MKAKKFKYEEITLGMLVSVNTCDDGNVYYISFQHPTNEFAFMTAQKHNGKTVYCGYLDYSYFYKPTKQQLAHEENEWVKCYKSN